MKDVLWFKEEIAPLLLGYDIKYKFFENGDFGDLHQVEFNSEVKGGEIDFWSTGWLGIHLVNFQENKELLNAFLAPYQEHEQLSVLAKLQELL